MTTSSFQTLRVQVQLAFDSLHELMWSHEILNDVTAETQSTSLILSQLERMKARKIGSENDEGKLKDTKGVSDI